MSAEIVREILEWHELVVGRLQCVVDGMAGELKVLRFQVEERERRSRDYERLAERIVGAAKGLGVAVDDRDLVEILGEVLEESGEREANEVYTRAKAAEARADDWCRATEDWKRRIGEACDRVLGECPAGRDLVAGLEEVVRIAEVAKGENRTANERECARMDGTDGTVCKRCGGEPAARGDARPPGGDCAPGEIKASIRGMRRPWLG